jgi:tRNA-modifying protein YgfZ
LPDKTANDDYRTIREGAAIGAISPRRQIAIAGRDRASFLQGLLTNDIQALAAGSGCYAAWLSPQGRMTADMHVLESGDMILLDVPEAQADELQQRLDQFLFSEDVTLASMAGSLTDVWLHGPKAAALIEAVLDGVSGLAAWAEYQHARVQFDGAPAVVARISQLGVPGFCIYVDPSREPALVSALEGRGARRVSRDAIEVARIEAGYPVFGVDMSEETIPLEAAIEDRAISFTKGCYVGQEVVIRILHRGGGRVVKKLVGLRSDATDMLPGSRVFSGAKDIGVVTSAAESPRLGPIALAYVHRDFTSPDNTVEIETPEGRRQATVTARPMP